MRTNPVMMDMSCGNYKNDACEDDVEFACPYVGIIFDETDSIHLVTYSNDYRSRAGDDEEYDDVNDLTDELEINSMLKSMHEDQW